MAGVIGGSSGYLTVNPTQDYVGQALRGVEDSFTRVRAEKIAKDRDKLAADQNLREQRRQDLKDSEEFDAKHPYASLGDNDKDFVMTLKKKYTDARRDVINTGSEKSQAIADKALANLNTLNERKKAMSLKAEEMLKNEKDYNSTSFNKAKDLVARTNKDLVADFDEDGNFVYNLVKRDPNNGTIIGIEKKNISDGELRQMYDIVPKFNVTGEKGMIDQYQKSIGKAIPKEEIIGGNVVKSLYTPGSKEVAKTMAQAATRDKSAVYAALEELRLDPENKDNYKEDVLVKVTGYYEDLLNKNATNVETSRLPNYKQLELNNKVKQQGFSNTNEAERIRISKLPSVTVSQSDLTDEDGIPVKDEKGNNIQIKKVSTTTKGGGGNSKQPEKAKLPTKAELKAKADALRKKYAPKK